MMRVNTLFLRLWALPRFGLMAGVRAYRLLLSPWLGASCRFEPTCSAYSLQALDTHGAVRGTYLTLHRLVRCNPWCEFGFDPVPPVRSGHLFTPLVGPLPPTPSSEKNPS